MGTQDAPLPVDPHPDKTPNVVRDFGDQPWWWACSQPERLPDDYACWLWECDACTLHLIAAVRRAPGDVSWVAPGPSIEATMAETLIDARAYRAEHGLRPL